VAKDSTAFAWGVGGGGAVILGSVLPFITPKIEGLYEVEPSARTTSVIFGAILLGLGFGMKPAGSRMTCSIILLIASALGTLGYLSFMAAGLAGFEDESEFGFGQTIEFSPNIGLIACIAGCIVAFVAAILGIRDRPKPTFAYGYGGPGYGSPGYGGYGQGYGAPGPYGGAPGPYGGGPGLPPPPGGGGSGYTF
jgi:hypothetical protein